MTVALILVALLAYAVLVLWRVRIERGCVRQRLVSAEMLRGLRTVRLAYAGLGVACASAVRASRAFDEQVSALREALAAAEHPPPRCGIGLLPE